MSKAKQSQVIRRWYGQYHDQLIAFLRRGIHRPADVQDLAQEVFLRLLRVDNPELVRNPKGYLFRVAVHVLDEWRSKERRAQLHDSQGLEQLASNLGAQTDGVRYRLVAEIRRALRTLPASYSAVLILRWHHGMTYTQIAQELDISQRMVKRYIAKGYAELRLRLEPGEGSS